MNRTLVNFLDDGVVLQLGFTPNVNMIFSHFSYSQEGVYDLLFAIRQELAMVSTTVGSMQKIILAESAKWHLKGDLKQKSYRFYL